MGKNLLNMNAGHNYGNNTPQAVPGIRTNSRVFRNLKEVFADCSTEKLNEIKKLNLADYYRHDHKKKMTFCLLCKSNFKDNETFEHTVGLPHEVNKRFYNFVQKRSQIGNINFIIYNPEWVECRYCDNGLMANNYSQKNSHIQEMIHIQRRGYCFGRVEQECRNRPSSIRAEQFDCLLEETDKYIRSPIVRENRVKNSLSANNEYRPLARPSRVDNQMRNGISLQKPTFPSQTYRHETYSSGTYYYRSTHKIDPYTDDCYSYSGYTPPRPKQEDRVLPTWVWVGVCCFIAYWCYRRS